MRYRLKASVSGFITVLCAVILFINTGEAKDSNDRPDMKVQMGHGRYISSIAISSDEKFILSGSMDYKMKLWDAASGKEIRDFGVIGWITVVALSPDGRYALSGSTSGNPAESLKLWDVVSGEEIRTFSGNTEYINDAVFSPDSQYVLSADNSKTIKLFNVSTGLPVKSFRGHSESIKSMAFSPDGKYIISGSDDKTVRLWDVSTGNEIKSFTGHTGCVESVSFSPDGRYILSGAGDKSLKLWDVASGKVIRTLGINSESSIAVNFSPDGKLILSSAGNEIRLFDAGSGEVLSTTTTGLTGCAAFSPGGSFIVLSSGTIMKSWDFKKHRFTQEFISYLNSINSVAFSADGRYILSAAGSIINLWDVQNGKKFKTLTGHSGNVNSAAFSTDSRCVVSCSDDGTIILWDVDSAKAIRNFSGHGGAVNCVVFSSDGKCVLSGADDGQLIIWDTATGNKIRTFEGEYGAVLSVAWSPDGKYIIMGTAGASDEFDERGTVLWDARTGKLVDVLSGFPGETQAVAFSPDGKYAISSSPDYCIHFWEPGTGKYIKSLSGHKLPIYALAFSPDGKYVISSSWGFTIKLWEVESEKEIKEFYGHSDSVHSVVFSPDGKSILSGSSDGIMRIWSIKTDQWVGFLNHSNGKDWLIFDSDGYWDSSRHGGDLVAMVQGMNCWNIDQFAVKNNRPDLVLAKLPDPDKELISEYRMQYLKRMKKLEKLSGIKETDLSSDMHVPGAEILRAEQENKTITLSLKLTDSMYDIVSYNIYVNDVPLYPGIGKNIKHGKELLVKEKIELSSGSSKIEVSCFNEKGAESYRAVTYANHEGANKGSLYFIGFGVSDYDDPAINDLMYTENDVLDLSKKFSAMGSEYDNIYVRTYTGKDVTVANIRAAREFAKKAGVDDTVILFISGHGMHDSDEYKTYYYITQNARLDNLKGTAADFETIEEILSGITARTKLFLMDTCDSGEVDDLSETTVSIPADKAGGKGVPRTTKGVLLQYNRGYFDRGRFIYNDIFRRTGAVVFSSSMGGEFSWEYDDLENGVFTESILEGLSGKADADGNGKVTIDELRDYVYKAVGRYTGDQQHPVIDRDNIYMKIELPVK